MQTVPDPDFELIPGDRRSDIDALLPEWQKLVDGHDSHYLQYQSPAWWGHLGATGHRSSILMLRIKQGSRIVGIVPLLRRNDAIRLTPVRAPYSRVTVPVIEVLGGQPLIPFDGELAARMFEFIFAHCEGIQAVYFKSVPQTSRWYDLLVNAADHARRCFPLIAREETFHFLTLPESFDLFLQRFTKKKRYNLKRQLRLMEEAYNGKLQLECVTGADRVDGFLEACSAVSAASWKESSLTRALTRNPDNQVRYADLANRGLLRSYILRDDVRPVAYALGYQYGNIYHYSDVAYAESELRLSPGTVLLFLIIRDLIENTGMRQVNFGISDADYKRQFADQHTRDRTLWVFRSTPRNQLLRAVHVASTWTVALVKSVIRGRDPRHGGAEQEETAPARPVTHSNDPATTQELGQAAKRSAKAD